MAGARISIKMNIGYADKYDKNQLPVCTNKAILIRKVATGQIKIEIKRNFLSILELMYLK
jgi:hypothetical protein